MVQICALASGSNGNCYYIGNEEEAVLVDIGITNRQLTKRMADANLSLKKVKAVFISHEHTDHIKGLRVVAAKNSMEAYATKKTFYRANRNYQSDKITLFTPGDTISVGKIKVHTFAKQHDAVEPTSFRIEVDGINVAVLTDLGVACENVNTHLQLCNAAFLESNYEHELLMTGRYPTFLKQRVASNYGHLSNEQAVELVKSLNGSPLKTIFLSHISEDNNRIELAMDAFESLQGSHQIEPTSRFGISKVVEL